MKRIYIKSYLQSLLFYENRAEYPLTNNLLGVHYQNL